MFGRSTYQGQGIIQQNVSPIAAQLYSQTGDDIASMIKANKERKREDQQTQQVANAWEKILDHTAGDAPWKPENWEDLSPRARVQFAMGVMPQITAEQERAREQQEAAQTRERLAPMFEQLGLSPDTPLDLADNVLGLIQQRESIEAARKANILAQESAERLAELRVRAAQLGLDAAELRAAPQPEEPMTQAEALEEALAEVGLTDLLRRQLRRQQVQGYDLNALAQVMKPKDSAVLTEAHLRRVKTSTDPDAEIKEIQAEIGPENFQGIPMEPERNLMQNISQEILKRAKSFIQTGMVSRENSPMGSKAYYDSLK